MENKTLTGPKGFLAAGVICGIKKSGKADMGMIVCPGGAKAAAVFTTNQIVSAAVDICRQHLSSREIEAVVVNSGNANTCTGKKGIKDALRMCDLAAEEIESDGENVLVASTGIIGEFLPMEKVEAGIKLATGKLGANAKAGMDFAKAIMTTDTKVKQAFGELSISGRKVLIAGTAKGAGMIGPNMATTLCFITTDIAMSKGLLQKALGEAIGESLNKLTVDGHQSTNDTAILLGSGLAGNKLISKQDGNYRKFYKVLSDVCSELARQMALDAEGATRMFKVVINGAANKSDAGIAARAIANYDLIKCAVHGGDPNWGRIICAVGSTAVKLNAEKLSCKLDNLTVFKNGRPCKFDRKKASKIVSQKTHTITVDL